MQCAGAEHDLTRQHGAVLREDPLRCPIGAHEHMINSRADHDGHPVAGCGVEVGRRGGPPCRAVGGQADPSCPVAQRLPAQIS